jgi:hypothetical protein
MNQDGNPSLTITGSLRRLRAAHILREGQCKAIMQLLHGTPATEVTVMQDTAHNALHVWEVGTTTVFTIASATGKQAD